MALSPHSEASKLLEAALEQMDGIIQGAKFEMPNYFGDVSDGNVTDEGAAPNRESPPMPMPTPTANTCSSPAATATAGAAACGGVSDYGSNGGIPEALEHLKMAILHDRHVFDYSDSGAQSIVSRPELNRETVTFLSRWLKNNPYPQTGDGSDGHRQLRGVDDDGGDGDTPTVVVHLEDRLLHAESERDALQLQASILGEQLERQGMRLHDMEQLLNAKKELLRKTEMALDRERKARTAAEEGNRNLSELSRLRHRCSTLEKENEELRKICSGNRVPTYLDLPSVRPNANGEHVERIEAKKEVGFADDDGAGNTFNSPPNDDSPGAGRPPRGLKKILGKIKRSNSGGQLEDHLKRNLQQQQQQAKSRPAAGGASGGTPEFRRGGLRSTAGGRLGGGWQSHGAVTSVTAASRGKGGIATNRPIAEWNVDMICTWLEGLGLEIYCGEVQKTIGTGADLSKMSLSDLESKLGVKNAMHRKKLFLALAARNDCSRPDAEGKLDFQWVLRWLDDIGLPQYKDSFLEARVDGRVLNVLTVDDLFSLKVTNQLHHLSIRRGIQVVRQHNFDPACLRRRAAPGEVLDAANVALWTNHRVMEWLKQVDLSEYAPNLRGSGVHGALLVFEPRFNDGLIASLLSIPHSKTLLRRHLSIHFNELVGRDVMTAKREAEQANNYVALTPTAKAKQRSQQMGQFTLKRKKSKSQVDYGDLVCPFTVK